MAATNQRRTTHTKKHDEAEANELFMVPFLSDESCRLLHDHIHQKRTKGINYHVTLNHLVDLFAVSVEKYPRNRIHTINLLCSRHRFRILCTFSNKHHKNCLSLCHSVSMCLCLSIALFSVYLLAISHKIIISFSCANHILSVNGSAQDDFILSATL